MVFDFFVPISQKLLDFTEQLSSNSVGKKLNLHKENDFPDLSNIKIALIGVKDIRGLNIDKTEVSNDFIRKSLYSMFVGNWNLEIADLGDVPAGNTMSDTYYVLKQAVSYLVVNNIIPVIIGGSQDLTYAIYTGYEYLKRTINLTSIDYKFDLHDDFSENISANSFLNHIIMQEPNYLQGYTNLGYQTYYNSQDHIELIDKLFFDAHRLGEVSSNIKLAEPILRDSDVVTLDLQSVQSSSSGNLLNFEPNGFSGKEICVLARYAGISDKVSTFGLFNQLGTLSESKLIAQIIWYFIEGVHFRVDESSFQDQSSMLKYNVQLDDFDLIFYKSIHTQRWWIVVPNQTSMNGEYYLPCGFEDYELALKNVIPERWWKSLKKNL